MKNSFFILIALAVFACGERKEGTEKESSGGHSPQGLHLTGLQIQLGGITTGLPQTRMLGDELVLNAQVSMNQNLANTVSARVMGRIDKLYFKNPGEFVSKGQPLFRIYSEELGIAINELMLSIEKRTGLNGQGIDIETIITSTKKKLELFGLNAEQIAHLEKNKNSSGSVDILSPVSGIITSVDLKEGSYVMAGADVFHLSELTSVWIEAQAYLDDLKTIAVSSMAYVTFPSLPGKVYTGEVLFVSPELSPSSQINTIRIELKTPGRELTPGIQAYVSVPINRKEALSLPTDAILLDGNGASVWLKTGHNLFESRMVRTGAESNGYTEIKEGLSPNDTVVLTGAYLLNSEYMLKQGTSPMEGQHVH
ncbi:MAG: efflux RND transporter periplasmic adaptor subunit [Bacteroidota bacterium]